MDFQKTDRKSLMEQFIYHIGQIRQGSKGSIHSDWFEAVLDSYDEKLAQAEAELERYKKRFGSTIICMCGSTRFKQTWIQENARLTGLGFIVLSVGLWGHHERKYPDEETKKKLDELHFRKIDLCDWVWVLDVDGYIGESTQNEINYAKSVGRPVFYLSKKFPAYKEHIDELQAELERVQQEKERLLDYASQLARERDALREGIEFYADPTTYYAIAFLPDPPCGDFIEDFDHTELGIKPGKMARALIQHGSDQAKEE